jgi:hypothetical protein
MAGAVLFNLRKELLRSSPPLPFVLLRSAKTSTHADRHLVGARHVGMSQLATLRHADEPQDCLLIGVDRKGPAHGQSDAIDPGCVKTKKFEARRE